MLPTTISPQIIFSRDDARPINKETVKALAESIAEVGIINPLRVRPVRRIVNGAPADAYEVSAGNHRLQAALRLNLEAVPCIVVDDDDLRAELVMIDENLCRAELSPADRAKQTVRRKAIYLELHPETANGGDRSSQTLRTGGAERFTLDAAKAIGRSERAIQLDVERGTDISDEALNLVRGTALDTGSYLDKLKRIDSSEQVETVQKALSGLARQLERDRAEALANRNKSRVEADVKQRAAKEVADILAEHVPGELWDALKANLYAAGATNIASALTNLIGQSVMDRSAA